jgi:hypothetical protein
VLWEERDLEGAKFSCEDAFKYVVMR